MAQEGQDPFLQLGDPSDVTNVNERRTQLLEDFISGGLGEFGGQAGDLANLAASLGGRAANLDQVDPTAGIQSFLGFAPALQDIALSATGPLAQIQNKQAQLLGGQAAQTAVDVAGNRFGSGAVQAATQAAAAPALQAQANVVQAQTGLAGQLLGGGLNILGNAPFRQRELQLQGLGLGVQGALGGASTFQGLAGQQLQGLSALGAPEFFQPTFAENPEFQSGPTFGGVAGSTLSGAGTGALIGSAFGPVGTLIGGGIGGIGGLFAGLF